MAERFTQRVNIVSPQIATGQVGEASIRMGLVDRLQSFKSQSLQLARQQAVMRGEEKAAQTTLRKEDGLTQKPEYQKVGIFGRTEALVHNKALRGAYLASLDTDIKTNVARIAEENGDNLLRFTDAVAGYRKGVVENVDPSVRGIVETALDDRIFSAQSKVKAATMAKERANAKSALEINEKALYDDAVLAAREQDIPGSAKSMVGYFQNIDAQREAGFLSDFEASEKKRAIELAAANENLIGQNRVLTNKGDFEGALKNLERIREKVPAGRTVEEHNALIETMHADITEALNIRNKIESLEDEQVDQQQESNFSNLFTGIVTPGATTTTASDVTNSLAENKITETQATTLVNLLNNRGLGVDNFSLINEFNRDIRNNVPADQVRNEIIANVGSALTEKTALELLNKVADRDAKETVLYNNISKRARAFIERRFGLTGPLASLDTEQNTRLANAIRDFDERVLNGEDPFNVADELVGKNAYAIAPNPRFGTKENLEDAMDKLNAAFDSKSINEDDYNFEFKNLERLRRLRDNIRQFDQSKKENMNVQ